MELGAFSISLSVRNIQASKSFYENLGFTQLGGDIDQKWLILKNGNSVIGLFEGMFEGNIITFNPGFDMNGGSLDSFQDIRDIQKSLKEKGVELTSEVEEDTSGPASFTMIDPDGNAILVDQHV